MARRRHLTMAQFRSAQGTMRRRSRTARLTTNLKLWRKFPGRYDIRGIDRKRRTRRTRRR